MLAKFFLMSEKLLAGCCLTLQTGDMVPKMEGWTDPYI